MPEYYAACALGLEQVLLRELQELGATAVEVRRGACAFDAEPRVAYRVCLWSRAAIRVQQELARGRARDREELYQLAASVDWSRSIDARGTLAIDGSVDSSFANDTRFPVLVVKDAICDQFRARSGVRPNVERDRPDLPVKLVLRGDEAILYRELGGAPLHKRGYREIQHKSPLNEALAAGLLLLTGWDRESPLVDPMCGSATFLIEAAFLATDRAPGLGRAFAFERFRDTDRAAWQDVYDDAERRAANGIARCPQLAGNDRHPGAIAIARKAVAAAGFDGRIQLAHGDARDWVPPFTPHTVVTNPPYGERLEHDPEQLAQTWRALGHFLHAHCRGATAFVLSGNPETSRHLGLRAEQKFPVRNGPIDCRWLRYTIDR